MSIRFSFNVDKQKFIGIYMRTSIIVIFLLFFVAIYSAAVYYVYSRGIHAFAPNQPLKRWLTITYWIVAYMFFAGMILERTASSAFSEFVFRIGTFWLPFLLYLLFALIFIDIVRGLNYFFRFLPPATASLKMIVASIVLGVVTLVILLGYINALSVRVVNIPVSIAKTVDGDKKMRVFMVSDVHLGALIGERHEKRLLRMVKEQSPDLVLICGDLIDSEIAPVVRKNLGRHIQEIDTPMGVYAITGNHEYIGGINQSLNYLKSINMTMLIDTVVTLPNGVQLVGRNDRAAGGFGKLAQKPLELLMENVDRDKPVIVMNHQPYNLDEAVAAGADLHLSGHTHHGQIWPLNMVTSALFELSWGYLQKENTHFYVSSGFGTWGPSIRLGNRPEVVVFDITFKN